MTSGGKDTTVRGAKQEREHGDRKTERKRGKGRNITKRPLEEKEGRRCTQ